MNDSNERWVYITGGSSGPGLKITTVLLEQEFEGRQACSDYHRRKRMRVDNNPYPDNPYSEGSPEAEAWDKGYEEEEDDQVLIDMGR